MIGVLAGALAVQLVLAAAAKTRTRGDAGQTLLRTVWPRVPGYVYIAGDVVVAGLLLVPVLSRLGGVLVVLAVGGVELLAVGYRHRGAIPCGCFGAQIARERLVLREHGTKALFAAEGLAVALDLTARVPPLVALGIALAVTGGVFALTPELAGGWRQLRPITPREALRALADSPEYQRWRPLLVNPAPAEVRRTGRSVRIVLDAWADERAVVLVATANRLGVRIRAHDATTLRAW